MKKRKIAIVSMFVAAILCGTLWFAGCKKNDDPPAPDGPKDTITISAEEIRLDLHESAELSAVSALGNTIEWENSAPSVAVYENGRVFAVSEGTAVLTAKSKSGDASASCNVTVYNSHSAPVLTTSTDSVRLVEGDTYTLILTTRYKDKEVNGVAYETKITGEAVSVTEKASGEFTVKAEKSGEAEIEITAEVYGVTLYAKVRAEVASASATVSFSKDFMPSENGFKANMELSEVTGTAELPLGLKVTKGWDDVTPQTTEWSSTDENIARVQDGKVIAESAGTATLSATIFDNPVQLEIIVGRNTVELTDTFTVERRDGQGEAEAIIESSLLGDVKAAYFSNGTNILAQYSDGTLTLNRAGMPATASQMGENVPFTVETNKVIYTMCVSLYTRRISTAGDLDSFILDSTDVNDSKPNYYSGYYVLANHIDYGGETYRASIKDGNTNYSFDGVFDGRGYNIDNLSVSYGGLLGTLADGAKVKNISFTNAVNNSGQVAGFLAQGVKWDGNFSVENIYVHFKTFYHCKNATRTDVDSNHRNYRNGGYTGVIFAGEQWNSSAKINSGTVNKVFVCADNYVTNLGEGTILGNGQSGYSGFANIYGYGIGGRITHWDSEDVTACGGVYADKAAIKAANIDYSAFENDDFWQIDFDRLPYPASLEMKLQSESVSENKVITAITGEGAEATVSALAQSYTIDLSDVKDSVSGTLTSLTVGANTYTDTDGSISYADGVITVNHALTLKDYGYRNYTAVFFNDGKELKVAGKTLFITFEITSKAELNAMQYVTDGAADDIVTEKGTTKVYGGYIVLGNNIAYNDTYKAPGYTFSGTFDGKGYNVDGLAMGNTNGIFGVLDGTAKIYNLSLTNAKNHADWTSGYIAKSATAWDSAFEMKNIYIQFAEFFTCWKNSGGDTDFMTSVLIAHENWGNANVLTHGKFTNIIVTATKYTKYTGKGSIVGYYNKDRMANLSGVYAYGFGDGTYISYNKDGNSSVHRTGNGYGVYSTKDELKTAVSDYSAFTADSFWQLDSDGVPVSKSAAALSV